MHGCYYIFWSPILLYITTFTILSNLRMCTKLSTNCFFLWLFMTFFVLKISAYQLCRDKDQLPAAWRQAVPRTRMHEHTIHTITVAHFTTHPNLMLYFYYKTKIITSSTGMSVMIGSFTAGYCFN